MRTRLFIVVLTLVAQAHSPPEFADFGKWETLTQPGSYGGFSPDGQWIVYGINRSNGENELRITRLSDGETQVAAFGSRSTYSSNSSIGVHDGLRQERPGSPRARAFFNVKLS